MESPVEALIQLSGKQRRSLRALAHHLDPVVLVGSGRVTDGVVEKVNTELSNHELIKVKLLDAEKAEVDVARERLCADTGAAHVQTIGHVLVLFRRNLAAGVVPPMPGEKVRRPSAQEIEADKLRRRGG